MMLVLVKYYFFLTILVASSFFCIMFSNSNILMRAGLCYKYSNQRINQLFKDQGKKQEKTYEA